MRAPAPACERTGAWAAVRRRASAADGYSLIEMLVVLAILGIVVGALTTLFLSASNAQVEMSRRVEAQQNARLALDNLRREIHCARSIDPASATAVPSITITLGAFCPTNRGAKTTAPTLTLPAATIGVSDASAFPSASISVSVGSATTVNCTGRTTTTLTGCSGGTGTYPSGTVVTGAANYTWCTRDKAGAIATTAGAGAPYSLWRYSGTSCSGTGRKAADHLTTHLVFTAYTAPTGGNLGALGVSLPVDLTPADARQRYTLNDDVVLRNSGRP